jgi:protein SCO1/2
MKSMFRITGGSAFLLTCALLSCAISAPQALGEGKRAAYFPAVTLQTQDGKDVRFYEDLIQGKIVVINFFYSRCTGKLCDQGLKNLEHLQKELGDRLGTEVFIYSITLDPEHDTPAVLKESAEAHGAKPGWTFLTGKAEDITLLRRKLGLFESDPKKDADRAQHTGMIKIGNDPFNRWSATSVLTRPERIVQMIDRTKPPARSKK